MLMSFDKKYHRNGTEACRTYDRERAKQPHRRAAQRERTLKWRELFPEKYRAQTAVSNAIRDNKLKKGTCCEIEGCNRLPIAAHHDDYSKPLEVRWLCWPHHAVADRDRLNRGKG